MSGDSILKSLNPAVSTLINPPDSGEAAPQPPSLYTQLLNIVGTRMVTKPPGISIHPVSVVTKPLNVSIHQDEVHRDLTGGEKNLVTTKQKKWSRNLLRIPNSRVFLSVYTGNP